MQIEPPTSDDSGPSTFLNIMKLDDLFSDDMNLFLQSVFEEIKCNENLTQKRYNVIDNWTTKVTTLLEDDDKVSNERASFIEPATFMSVPG